MVYGPEVLAIVPYRKPVLDIVLKHASCRPIDAEVERGERLLPEVVLMVFVFMDAAGLCRVARVDKRWSLMSERDMFWEILCVRRFSLHADYFKPRPEPVKRLYEAQAKVR